MTTSLTGLGRMVPRALAALAYLASIAHLAVADGGVTERTKPREIPLETRNVAPELEAATRRQPIERGEDRPVVDGLGWVVGIPKKIILWDRRVENHRVSATTEQAVADYLADRGLDHVKVRVNQYAPVADWKRLRENTAVAWPYRCTLGVVSVASEAILPGRIFGRDHYNPYTGTIHIYSDVPALAVKQASHSTDFTRRDYPGTYSLATMVPVLNLWPDAIATGDALAYAERRGAAALEREEFRILYPAYGASVGGVVGDALPGVFLPVYAGTVIAGHVVGRWEAGRVDEPPHEAALQTALDDHLDRLPVAVVDDHEHPVDGDFPRMESIASWAGDVIPESNGQTP